MKIKINYDVIDKIHVFNKGYDLKRVVALNTVSTIFTFFIISMFLDLGPAGIGSIAGFSIWTSIDIFADKKMSVSKSIAQDQLQDLVRDLKTIQVHTNLTALQEAKVIKTNYKLKLDDQKKPFLKQNKYIQVSAYNGLGNQYEATLYQEHIIGTKDYDISVGEPEKKVQVKRKLVKSM